MFSNIVVAQCAMMLVNCNVGRSAAKKSGNFTVPGQWSPYAFTKVYDSHSQSYKRSITMPWFSVSCTSSLYMHTLYHFQDIP